MGFTTVKTTLEAAYPGMRSGMNKNRVTPGLNEEASAEMRWGIAVKQGTDDAGALLLTATTNKIKGLVQSTHAMAKETELGDTGVKPDAVFDCAEEGELYVLTEEAVTPASDVRVRCVAGGGEVAGAFRATADSTDCILLKHCKWAGTYASGYALLKFDFRNRDQGTADT